MENINEQMIVEFSAKVAELKHKALEKENSELKDKIKELEDKLEFFITALKATISDFEPNNEIEKVKVEKIKTKSKSLIPPLREPKSKIEKSEEPKIQSEGNLITKLNNETLNRVRCSKRFKLAENNSTHSIEFVVVYKGGKLVRHRQIIITKYNNQTNKILSSKEFDCDTQKDLDIVEEYLHELNIKNQTTRCITWLINKLDISYN